MDEFQLRKKSYAASGTRGKPILVTPKRRTETYQQVLHNGIDCTPKPLSPEVFTGGKERQLSVFDIGNEKFILDPTLSRSTSLNVFKTQSTVRFKNDVGRTQIDSSNQYKGSKTSESGFFDVFISGLASEDRSNSSRLSGSTETVGTSAGTLPSDEDAPKVMKEVQTHVSLILRETNTFFLLDLPSSTVLKDTEEGDEAEQENEKYLYLTEGRGRNRKVLNVEVQTLPVLMKTRMTTCQKIKTKSGIAFASDWDMYDTYNEHLECDEEEEQESDKSEDEFQYSDTVSLDSFRLSSDERQMIRLIKNPRFLEALSVIERLLASNYYREQQKIFRGLYVPDDFRTSIEFKYRLKHLWTFANNYSKGKSVNSINWNPTNKDIVAVGYGKFYFSDVIPGLVLVWNIKNPVQPERQYTFSESVTSVAFSKTRPTLLAVGFNNGSVIILNVFNREKIIIGENTPTFEAVWDISWQSGQETIEGEVVCATFDDGRIIAYTVQAKLEPFQLMRVAKAEGKLKGYSAMKKCTNLVIPSSRYSSAMIHRKHPVDKSLYFVGTREGLIHKCSVHYLNQHLDMFEAHGGPINEMKFSPFCDQIFLTCGEDWMTRIWAEGICEPLLEMFVTMQSVQGADWSPAHSTIFATIRGSSIQIWDLQRKVYAPQSNTQSPTNSRNTKVQFTDSGRCLIVGDIDGNVHVFSLEDMPFPPFFQENLLFESFNRALITDQKLLNKVKKLRRQSKCKM